ncbi:MAG TPA: hypothetical protein VF507_02010 [Pyrinomonadaceae bacterium]
MLSPDMTICPFGLVTDAGPAPPEAMPGMFIPGVITCFSGLVLPFPPASVLDEPAGEL